MFLQDRHDLVLVIRQHGDDFIRLMGIRKTGETADIAEQDGCLARLPRPGGDRLFGRGNLVCDLGREKTRQVLRRLAFGDRAVQQVPCPVDRDRDDRGDQQDRDDLVELGAHQHRVIGHVIDIVAGHHFGTGGIDRVGCKPGPARRGDKACRDHITRLEAQRTERDKDKHVKQRRRFQIE